MLEFGWINEYSRWGKGAVAVRIIARGGCVEVLWVLVLAKKLTPREGVLRGWDKCHK